MRSLVIISTIVAATVALRCYNGGTAVGIGSNITATCVIGTNQCFKRTTTYKSNVVELFGCDVGALFCSGISNGKCSSQKTNGASQNTCCCNSDLCNSAGFFQPLLAASVLVLGRLL